MITSQAKRACIVLPAYNEEPVIDKVLRKLPKKLLVDGITVTFSVIVVDDGSTDSTAAHAKKLATTVLRHPLNMGSGAATRTGLHYARRNRFDLAITMDADGQHAASDVISLIKVMIKEPTIDLLIGTRLLNSVGNMPSQRKIGNRLLSYVTLIAFGTYVSDSQSGFRVFSKRALANLEYHSNSYTFCSEMLWQAKRRQLVISEYPIRAIYTTYSQLKGQKSYSGGLKILKEILVRRVMELIA